MIDTQFLPSALRKEINYAERVTGKEVKLAIVLHPNPDRFNGTAWLKSKDVPVVTCDQVRDLIAAGLTLKAHVLGSGCSPAHVVVEWEGHLFGGDLIANGTHSWFENGRADEWLHRLEELRALHPQWIPNARASLRMAWDATSCVHRHTGPGVLGESLSTCSEMSGVLNAKSPDICEQVREEQRPSDHLAPGTAGGSSCAGSHGASQPGTHLLRADAGLLLT